MEELIQEEILDETDVYVDIKKQIQVARARAKRQGQGDIMTQVRPIHKHAGYTKACKV